LTISVPISPRTTVGSSSIPTCISTSRRRALPGLVRSKSGFSILHGKSLKGASFTSVKQLRDHIDAFIANYNENAAPFIWTKSKVHQRRFKDRRISQL
jgi:hypothetical protein